MSDEEENDSALALVEPPNLSDFPKELQRLSRRDHKLALGVAYKLQGYTWRQAARLAGYINPKTGKLQHETLWHRGHAYYEMFSESERLDELEAVTFDNAIEAQAAIGQRIRAGEMDELSLPQASVVSGIATDKATRLLDIRVRRDSKKEDDTGSQVGQLLAKLHAQGGGTITVSGPEQDDHNTIDITPEDD